MSPEAPIKTEFEPLRQRTDMTKARHPVLKSLVCVESAVLLFAGLVPAAFLAATLLGMIGARLQGIPLPSIDVRSLLQMFFALVVSLVPAALPAALVLGVLAARIRRHRRRALLTAGACSLIALALLSAYPFAALSGYFFSNTPPTAPFPWGADWHVPLRMVLAFAYVGLVGFPLILGPLLLATIWILERWTRPEGASQT